MNEKLAVLIRNALKTAHMVIYIYPNFSDLCRMGIKFKDMNRKTFAPRKARDRGGEISFRAARKKGIFRTRSMYEVPRTPKKRAQNEA